MAKKLVVVGILVGMEITCDCGETTEISSTEEIEWFKCCCGKTTGIDLANIHCESPVVIVEED